MGAIDLVVENNVEVAGVLGVGGDGDGTLDRVVRLYGDHVAEVEDGLCVVEKGERKGGGGGEEGRRGKGGRSRRSQPSFARSQEMNARFQCVYLA